MSPVGVPTPREVVKREQLERAGQAPPARPRGSELERHHPDSWLLHEQGRTGEVHIPLDPVAGPARSHPGLERRRRGSAGRRRHRMDKRVSGQPGGEGRRT